MHEVGGVYDTFIGYSPYSGYEVGGVYVLGPGCGLTSLNQVHQLRVVCVQISTTLVINACNRHLAETTEQNTWVIFGNSVIVASEVRFMIGLSSTTIVLK